MENTARKENVGATSRHQVSMDQKIKTVDAIINQNAEKAVAVSKQKAERLEVKDGRKLRNQL